VRLDDVLAGLRWAWPPRCPRAELEALIVTARVHVPRMYGTDPNT
jgi:hypothetical protein